MSSQKEKRDSCIVAEFIGLIAKFAARGSAILFAVLLIANALKHN